MTMFVGDIPDLAVGEQMIRKGDVNSDKDIIHRSQVSMSILLEGEAAEIELRTTASLPVNCEAKLRKGKRKPLGVEQQRWKG